MKIEKAREIIERYPMLSKKELGKLLYKENPMLFKDAEDGRMTVRRATGSVGKESENYIKTDKYIGNLPQGEKNDFSPFILKGKRVGVICDLHIPYHDLDAIQIALTELKKQNIDTLLILGDLIDAYNLSRWEKDPNKRNHNYELEMLTVFLDDIRDYFGDIEIVYSLGNHCERYEKFIYQKSPEFAGMHILSWKHILNLRYQDCQRCNGTGVYKSNDCPDCEKGKKAINVSRGIHLVKNKKIVKIGKLNAVHGHQLRSSSPVNAARGFFMKAKSNVIAGHLHQVSEHTSKNINNEITGAWSIGCLCEMHPEYAPINDWSHGFSFVEIIDSKGNFSVKNYKIINGKLI